ncbi:ATP-binding cassette domain-containing protein [Mycetocola reblochoni]|uniref:ABC transporter, ATP-binding protein n=2 Tax=Mycetocola reblochoni TaxID=331618 RepID=A0A1R4K4I7_9MICO|nr:ATP-binding cassette domain-containing protein [Mycetocola reblochoni]SJN39102.1 ABC transporter, ATP-binding protein [Mycetocola reblochoni REB411]
MSLVVDDLTVRYQGASGPAASGVSFSLAAGELVAIMGPSGAGKSALLRALALGQDYSGSEAAEIVGGAAFISGAPVRSAGKREHLFAQHEIAYLPQNAGAALPGGSSIGDFLSAPLIARDKRADRGAVGERAARSIDAVGLTLSTLSLFPSELSGGQRQRAAIARALMIGPRLLLADEPASGVDPSVRGVIGTLLRTGLEAGMAAVVVSHDLELLVALDARVIVLDAGAVVADGPLSELLAEGRTPFLASLAGLSAAAGEQPDTEGRDGAGRAAGR